MPKRYPVRMKELKKGTRIEMQDHQVSERTARRLARQELQKHPTFYQVMPLAEQMMKRKEQHIKPIRRTRPMPRPQSAFMGGTPWG